jgi:hypothetical protein
MNIHELNNKYKERLKTFGQQFVEEYSKEVLFPFCDKYNLNYYSYSPEHNYYPYFTHKDYRVDIYRYLTLNPSGEFKSFIGNLPEEFLTELKDIFDGLYSKIGYFYLYELVQ